MAHRRMSRKLLSFSASVAAPLDLLTAAFAENGLPEGFAFGTAVAGFQVDLGCPTLPASECNDPRSDWYQFATWTVSIANPSNHLRGQPLHYGPGFYELYEDELDRMLGLGLTHLRLSIEWSRIFPESTRGVEGQVALWERASPSGLAYYRRLLGRIDFLGVNYYTVGVLQGSTNSVLAAFSPLATFNPLPLEQGEVTYPQMDRFLAEHFQYLRRAIDRGAKVEGYYLWSLLDNYEWNHGMAQKFGLYAVEPQDPQKLRTSRASAEAFRQIVAGRGEAEELYRRFPIPEGP